MPFTPMKFQERASTIMASRRRMVNASEMGTGKTGVIICAAEKVLKGTLRKQAPGGLIYIVCPKSLRLTWQDQIGKWLGEGEDIQIIKDTKTPLLGAKWTIFSYQTFVYYLKNYPTARPLIVAFDEAHALKFSDRTRTILGADSIIRDAPYVWFATGTPFPNNVSDCYFVFNFCLRGKLGKFWDFVSKFAYIKKGTWGKRAYGCQEGNLPELHNRVKGILHRDTIAENLQELPGFLDIDIPIESTLPEVSLADQKKIIRAIEEDIIDNSLSEIRRLIGLAKVKAALEFIEEMLESVKPLVVFCYHVDVVDEITKGVSEAGHSVASISGKTKESERQKRIKDFQDGLLDCLVLSTAGEAGITLTASWTTIFVELGWSGGGLDQQKARTRRIGQDNICKYYFLYVPNTIDETIVHVVRRKCAQVNKFWAIHEGKFIPNKDESWTEEEITT